MSLASIFPLMSDSPQASFNKLLRNTKARDRTFQSLFFNASGSPSSVRSSMSADGVPGGPGPGELAWVTFLGKGEAGVGGKVACDFTKGSEGGPVLSVFTSSPLLSAKRSAAPDFIETPRNRASNSASSAAPPRSPEKADGMSDLMPNDCGCSLGALDPSPALSDTVGFETCGELRGDLFHGGIPDPDRLRGIGLAGVSVDTDASSFPFPATAISIAGSVVFVAAPFRFHGGRILIPYPTLKL